MATVQASREIVGGDSATLAELEALYEQGDGLTPVAVVDTARDPASALHSHFEWNDSIAGEKYRLDQARTLIQAFELRITEDDKPMQTRYYLNVVERDEHVYKRTEEVIRLTNLREQHRLKILRQLQRLQRELEVFDEFAGAASAISAVISQLESTDPS